MPLIILGLLVVGGLLAYIYFTGHSDRFTADSAGKKEEPGQDESSTIIYLPTDIEKEKKKRKVKTGK